MNNLTKKVIIILLCFFLINLIEAQEVKILDIKTYKPIENVIIANKNVFYLSDKNGKINIEKVSNSDTLFLKHISYEPISIIVSELKNIEYTVLMNAKSIVLDQFLVSANRWEQNCRELPFKIEKINLNTIALSSPQTAADLISTNSGVYMQKSQLAGGSPMIRGFATNRVMLVIDGVRMNNAIFRTGNVQNIISIDPQIIDNAEILYGPGAVMYGSDAIGGVMDFHSKDVNITYSNKANINGNFLKRFSSANNESTIHTDFSITYKKVGLFSSITFSIFDDLIMGKNGNKYYLRQNIQKTIDNKDTIISNSNLYKQTSSGYNQLSVLQKIKYKINNYNVFDYGIYYSQTSNLPRYDKLCDIDKKGKLTYAEWFYGPQIWIMNKLSFLNTQSTFFWDKIRSSLAIQHFEESRNTRKFNKSNLSNQKENIIALSLNVDTDKKITKTTDLFYGFELVKNIVNSKAFVQNIKSMEIKPNNTRYPNGSLWNSYAIYSDIKQNINNVFFINLGLRYSIISLNAKFDTTLFYLPFNKAELHNNSLNGAIGFVFSPNNEQKYYLNFSNGLRAPNIDDIGKIFETRKGAVVTPNNNLKPENAWNAETGVNLTFFNKLNFYFSTFYTYLNNALSLRPFKYNNQDSIMYDGTMSKIFAMQNLSHAFVYGFQANIGVKLNKYIELLNSITYQKGEEYDNDSLKYFPLRHIAPLFGSTHLKYLANNNFVIDFYCNYNDKMNYENLPLSERQDNAPYAKDSNGAPFVPAWYTLNLSLMYKIDNNFELALGIGNITNQLYKPYASGISAAGKNLSIAIKAFF